MNSQSSSSVPKLGSFLQNGGFPPPQLEVKDDGGGRGWAIDGVLGAPASASEAIQQGIDKSRRRPVPRLGRGSWQQLPACFTESIA